MKPSPLFLQQRHAQELLQHQQRHYTLLGVCYSVWIWFVLPQRIRDMAHNYHHHPPPTPSFMTNVTLDEPDYNFPLLWGNQQ